MSKAPAPYTKKNLIAFFLAGFIAIASNSFGATNSVEICNALPSTPPELSVKNILKTAMTNIDAKLTPNSPGTYASIKDLWKNFESMNRSMSMNEQTHGFDAANIELIQKKYPDLILAWKQALHFSSEVEREIYKLSNTNSHSTFYEVTPELVEKKVYETASTLSGKIQNSSLSTHFKNSALSRLRNLKVLTATSISQEPNLLDQVSYSMLFNTVCGDYTVIQAVATIVPKTSDLLFTTTQTDSNGIKYTKIAGLKEGATPLSLFVICPGLVATTANLPYKRLGLDFALAHELAHSINFPTPAPFVGATTPTPQGMDSEALKEQTPILNCLDQNYSNRFSSLSNLHSKFENEANQISDFVTRLQSSAHLYSSTYGDLLEKFKTYFKTEPNSVDSHASEILADYWATLVIQENFKVVDSAEFTVASYMNLFCSLSKNINENFPNGDEGIHPSLEFRVENFLRNPTVFSQISSPPSGVWCEL